MMIKNNKFSKHLLLGAFAVFLSACNNASTNKTETSNTQNAKMDKAAAQNLAASISNREKSVELLENFNTGDHAPLAYINPNKYIQHNLSVADGIAGFGAVMQHAPSGGFKAKIHRSFAEGDYVVTHTEYDFFGPKAGFDVFRFEDGLIVEHWDNLTPITPPNPSGHTQFDGASEVTDIDKTAANKKLSKTLSVMF